MADYMTQGNEVIREDPFVQVGGQTMRTPTSVNLEDMFRTPGMTPGQFQPPAGPQVPPIVIEGLYASEMVTADTFLENSSEWTKYSDVGGDYYMPSSGQPGEFHVAPDNSLHEWKNGSWVPVKDATDRLAQFKGTVSKDAYHVSVWRGLLNLHSQTYSVQNTVQDLYAGNIGASAAIAQLEAGRTARLAEAQAEFDAVPYANRQSAEGYQAYEAARIKFQRVTGEINAAFNTMIEGVDGLKQATQSLTQAANSLGLNISDLDLSTREGANAAKQLINDALIGKDYTGLLRLQGSTITQDFGASVSDMMQEIDAGTFSFYDENGDLDIDAMIEAGGAQGWFGEALRAATESGFLQSDFMQWVDDDENPDGPQIEVFSEEIQNIMDAMDDPMAEQHTKFMKDLRHEAALQGFSIEDVIISKQRLAYETEATAQFANEFAGMLDREMEASYTSMGVSLESLIRQKLGETKALEFKTEYERQMTEALKDYQLQDQILAEEMAQERQKNHFNILIGLISAAAIPFLLL